ncbi:MAG: FG-GAP-like repeat-containing protein [Phycisphaerales bacterium]
MTILYNDGKGAFVSPIDFATGENPRYVVALDFDNDGLDARWFR